jgi:hypothetical protein
MCRRSTGRWPISRTGSIRRTRSPREQVRVGGCLDDGHGADPDGAAVLGGWPPVGLEPEGLPRARTAGPPSGGCPLRGGETSRPGQARGWAIGMFAAGVVVQASILSRAASPAVFPPAANPDGTGPASRSAASPADAAKRGDLSRATSLPGMLRSGCGPRGGSEGFRGGPLGPGGLKRRLFSNRLFVRVDRNGPPRTPRTPRSSDQLVVAPVERGAT